MPEPIEVRKVPIKHVSDASGLIELIDAKAIDPDRVIAVIGKTKGNGGVNDYTRIIADRVDLFSGAIEDRYVGAFLDPRSYAIDARATRADRIASIIELLRVAALSSYENRPISTGVLLLGTSADPVRPGVPTTSVVTTTEDVFVLRVTGDLVEWVPVRKGSKSGSMVEVFGALQSGDLVVARGTDEIRPGTRVAPVHKK